MCGFVRGLFAKALTLNLYCPKGKSGEGKINLLAHIECCLKGCLFSSRYRKENIETARKLLGAECANANEEAIEDGLGVFQKQETVWDEIRQAISTCQKPNCPACKKGRLHYAGEVYHDPNQPG